MSASNTFLKPLRGGWGAIEERQTENVHNRVKTLKHVQYNYTSWGSLNPNSNFIILNTGIYGKNRYFLLVNANAFCFSNLDLI